METAIEQEQGLRKTSGYLRNRCTNTLSLGRPDPLVEFFPTGRARPPASR